MEVTITLPPDLAKWLPDVAKKNGKTVEQITILMLVKAQHCRKVNINCHMVDALQKAISDGGDPDELARTLLQTSHGLMH